MKRLSIRPVFVFALFTLIHYASSTPLPQATGISWELQGDPPDAFTCVSDRSSDYYGLGVRLGVYMSWITGWIANVSVPDEVAGALDQNSIFLFALIVAMVRCTITQLLSSMDGLILMHLAGGSLFSCLSVWGYRTCFYHLEGPKGIQNFGGFGTHLRLLLSMAVSTYGLWYWYFGIDGSLLSPTQMIPDNMPRNPPECDNIHTFFFAKLKADAGIRIYYIMVCIGCMIYFGVMTAISVIGPVTRVYKMTWLAKHRFFHTTSRLKYATGFNCRQLSFIFYLLSFGNFFWIIFSIVTVELTLNYNHVQSVLGSNGRIFFPSQLLPTVIGACSLIRILYLRLEKYRDPEDHKPSLPKRLTMPERSTTIAHGMKGWLRIFTPSAPRDGLTQAEKDRLTDDSLDEDLVGKPAWWRYMMAWLPWLNVPCAGWFKSEQPEIAESAAGKDKHENSDLEVGKEPTHRDTWASDDTTMERRRSSVVPNEEYNG